MKTVQQVAALLLAMPLAAQMHIVCAPSDPSILTAISEGAKVGWA